MYIGLNATGDTIVAVITAYLLITFALGFFMEKGMPFADRMFYGATAWFMLPWSYFLDRTDTY